MTLYKKLIIISSLLPSFVCMSMEIQFLEKEFINFNTLSDDYLHDDFKIKWGDSIPHILIKEISNGKSVYKAVSQNYVMQHSHTNNIEIQDTFNPLILKQNTQEISIALEVKETSLQKKIQKKQLLKDKLLFQNIELKKQLLLIEKINKESSSNTHQPFSIKIEKPCIKKITPQKKTHAQQKKAAPKKKKTSFAGEQKNKPVEKNILPSNNTNGHESKQKMVVLRSLMRKYKVQTPAQLKNKLHEKCEFKDCHGIYKRINPQCTWSYCSFNNDLVINLNDIKSDSESDDECSGSWSNSID